jgi:hypothetical protein
VHVAVDETGHQRGVVVEDEFLALIAFELGTRRNPDDAFALDQDPVLCERAADPIDDSRATQ